MPWRLSWLVTVDCAARGVPPPLEIRMDVCRQVHSVGGERGGMPYVVHNRIVGNCSIAYLELILCALSKLLAKRSLWCRQIGTDIRQEQPCATWEAVHDWIGGGQSEMQQEQSTRTSEFEQGRG